MEWSWYQFLKKCLPRRSGSSHKQCLGCTQNLVHKWYCSCLTTEQCPERLIFTQLLAIYRVLSHPFILKTSLQRGWGGCCCPTRFREGEQLVQDHTARRQQNQARTSFPWLHLQFSFPAAVLADRNWKAKCSNTTWEMNHASATWLCPSWVIPKSHSCRGTFFLFSLYEIMSLCQRAPRLVVWH